MSNVIELNNVIFTKVELKFHYFNKEDKFSGLNNKTVLQTIEKPRYSKYKEEIYAKYRTYLNSKIGDFLAILKENNDEFYKKFLNAYGDQKYCKFILINKEILNKKGLYVYKDAESILYIGRCKDSFKSRFNNGYGSISPKNCYLDGQATNCHINSLINLVSDSIELYISVFVNDEEIENKERMLIQSIRPQWNISLT